GVRRTGLGLLSPRGAAPPRPLLASDPAALASADFVLFATKTWQLADAAAEAAPHLGAHCLVCGVQNGVVSAAELARAVGADNVLGATCRIISFIEEPGVIRHVGVDPTILIGELDGGLSARVEQLSAALSCGDRLDVVGSPDIVAEIWKKMLFFAPVSGVGSLTGAPIGEFRADPKGRDLLVAAIAEVAEVARALAVDLPQDAAERALAFIDTIPAEGTSSMQRDFAAGRPTELEALSGELSRQGRALGVPTPTHDLVCDTLRPRDQAARSAAGANLRDHDR
ncbi:MAG: 2-dehydropantoate 2-reductase, partial [Acidobacteriota bacterium]